MFELSAQGMEKMIGLLKIYCAQNGTGKTNMPQKMGEHADLTGPCYIANNLMDLSKCKKEMNDAAASIWNGPTTEAVYQVLDNESPPFMQILGDEMDAQEIGGSMGPMCSRILQGIDTDVNVLSQMRKELPRRMYYQQESDDD